MSKIESCQFERTDCQSELMSQAIATSEIPAEAAGEFRDSFAIGPIRADGDKNVAHDGVTAQQAFAEPVSKPGVDAGLEAGEFRDRNAAATPPPNGPQGLVAQQVKVLATEAERVAKPAASSDSRVMPHAAMSLPAAAPLRRGGRPTLMTPELEEKVCVLISLGLSRRQAASYLNIDHNLIGRAILRDEEFAHNLRRAHDLGTVQPLMTLIGESQKSWRVAVRLLEHMAKHPPRLTEEEKEELHRERLADEHRKVDLWFKSHVMQQVAMEELERARLKRELAARREEYEAGFAELQAVAEKFAKPQPGAKRSSERRSS